MLEVFLLGLEERSHPSVFRRSPPSNLEGREGAKMSQPWPLLSCKKAEAGLWRPDWMIAAGRILGDVVI